VFSCNCISSCRNLPQKKTFFFSSSSSICLVHIDLLYIFQSLILYMVSSFMRAIGGAIEVLFALYPCPFFKKLTTISCSYIYNSAMIYIYIHTDTHVYIFLIKKNQKLSVLFALLFQLSFSLCRVTVYIVTILFLFFAVMGREHSQICHSVSLK
jgi:hypothetical protein